MSNRTYIPIKPIPIRERNSILFLEYGQVDVVNQAFVLSDANGVRTQIPIGGLACLMLEPGTRVTHAAITLASRVGCLLVWVGEGGVRLMAASHEYVSTILRTPWLFLAMLGLIRRATEFECARTKPSVTCWQITAAGLHRLRRLEASP